MPTRVTLFLFSALLFILLNGCETTREIDDDIFVFSGKRLVCYGDWGNDRPISILLLSNLPPLDTSSFKTVDNATVSLFVNGNFEELLLFDGEVYRSPSMLIPVSGFEYNIEVEAESYPSITSRRVKIPSIPLVVNANAEEVNEGKQVKISISIRDDENELNYYSSRRNLYSEGEYIKVTNKSREEDEIPVFMNIESDRLFNGNDYTTTMVFNKEILLFENFIPVDTISVDSVKATIYSVSPEYTDYFDSLPDDVNYGGFLPPETSIYTNIENGYGVIGAYSISEVGFQL